MKYRIPAAGDNQPSRELRSDWLEVEESAVVAAANLGKHSLFSNAIPLTPSCWTLNWARKNVAKRVRKQHQFVSITRIFRSLEQVEGSESSGPAIVLADLGLDAPHGTLG